MVEDDAKKQLITNLRSGLENEPSVVKKNNQAFQNDNIQVKLDPNQSKATIIKRGQGSVQVDMKLNSKSATAGATYQMKSAKLVKFKDTRLDAV